MFSERVCFQVDCVPKCVRFKRNMSLEELVFQRKHVSERESFMGEHASRRNFLFLEGTCFQKIHPWPHAFGSFLLIHVSINHPEGLSTECAFRKDLGRGGFPEDLFWRMRCPWDFFVRLSAPEATIPNLEGLSCPLKCPSLSRRSLEGFCSSGTSRKGLFSLHFHA